MVSNKTLAHSPVFLTIIEKPFNNLSIKSKKKDRPKFHSFSLKKTLDHIREQKEKKKKMEAMTGLQRSEISFRRQGSSGLVWEDRFLSGDLNQMKQKEEEESKEFRESRTRQRDGSTGALERSRSDGARVYQTVKMPPPAVDPPSPKVSGCGFCGVFGKPVNSRRRHKSGKRKS